MSIHVDTQRKELQLFVHGIYVFVRILLHLEGFEADSDVPHLAFDLTIVQLVGLNNQQLLFSTMFNNSIKNP